jgi:hypothetical protein
MEFFESMLTLMLVAIVFLQISRRLLIPYPTSPPSPGRRRSASIRNWRSPFSSRLPSSTLLTIFRHELCGKTGFR